MSVSIISKINGFIADVKLNTSKKIEGVILTNHNRTHDWILRKARFIEKIDDATFCLVKLKVKALLEL